MATDKQKDYLQFLCSSKMITTDPDLKKTTEIIEQVINHLDSLTIEEASDMIEYLIPLHVEDFYPGDDWEDSR